MWLVWNYFITCIGRAGWVAAQKYGEKAATAATRIAANGNLWEKGIFRKLSLPKAFAQSKLDVYKWNFEQLFGASRGAFIKISISHLHWPIIWIWRLILQSKFAIEIGFFCECRAIFGGAIKSGRKWLQWEGLSGNANYNVNSPWPIRGVCTHAPPSAHRACVQFQF